MEIYKYYIYNLNFKPELVIVNLFMPNIDLINLINNFKPELVDQSPGVFLCNKIKENYLILKNKYLRSGAQYL